MKAALAHRQLMTLPEQIAGRIFAAIERGEYAPGERIREETIAEQLAVSRGPVREALRILESDAVVRILPNRGAHVTQLTIKEVSDIFEIRRELVGPMVRGLARQDTRFIDCIEDEVRELELLAKEPDAGEAYLAVSHRLGRLLSQGCGNDRLGDIMSSLARQTRRYSKLGLATPARRNESAKCWRAMANALKAGEIDSAAAAVEKLIHASRLEAVRQLQSARPNPIKDISQ
ncbi:GntR family transcriptional regulator [Variovorax sp. OV329]|uniref:GntR family transcriptional regulator n=1 Tax=Variovorax sp. OV329 TaxID=1882825 RepID=UPI0008E2B5F2|nr:GntR family transcriptional regulator [Variovorax sp. OV329]SFN51428.1 transcriptional regulator, GntR family [Variovorax sp. OV329]